MMRLFAVVVVAAIVLIVVVSLENGVDPAGLTIALTLGIGLLVILAPRLGGNAAKQESASTKIPARPLESLHLGYNVRGFLFVGAFVCYGLAVQQLLTPDASRSTGRWSWLINLFIEWLGPIGPAALFFCAGTVLVVSAIKYKSN